MMIRYAGVAIFGGFLGLSTLTAAHAQLPSLDLKPATGAEAPATTPAATPPGASAPATSGNPEVDAAIKRWDELREQLAQTQIDYKSAKPEDRGPIEEKFKKLKADGEKFRPELLKVMEAALKKDPKSTAVTTFLAAYANGCYNADDHDEALRVAELLIAADYPNKRIYSLAGRAAYNTMDFDKAEKYFKIAQAAGGLDNLAENFSKLVPAYKPLWKKEQDIRAAEAKLTGDQALPQVLLKTNKGDIVLELFENEAPQTVGNFVNLVEKGFYNNLSFHRVLPGFMAQGGDPKGDGTGGPGYEIPCECYKENKRLHFRGALSMAHSGKDTGGSQFFITFVPTDNLDGPAVSPSNTSNHTVFGRVVSGFDTLVKLQRRNPDSRRHNFDTTPLPVPDRILEAKVLNKRNHPYEPTKVAAPGTAAPGTTTPPAGKP
jgi:cyclophilin family peptidyl-prolyl cis-trans isomerase